MKFCRNCGGELAKDAKFCKHCGFDLTSKSEPTDQQQATEEGEQKGLYTEQTVNNQNEQPKDQAQATSAQPAQPKQPTQMSKQTKIIAGIIGALIIFLFVGYKVAETMTSYERKIDKFETAMHEADHDALAGILTTNNASLEINEDAVGGLIEYYSDYPSELNDLVRHLREQGKAYADDSEFMVYESDYYPINLVKNGKFLIFDRFDIQVSPVYFNVYTNYQDTEILMDGEVIGTATSDDYSKEFGPFLPGTYTFTARYVSDYVELETEATYTNYNPGYVSEVNLYIEADEVYFEVTYADGLEEVKLLINGEDSGINLLETDTVGPLPIDGTVEVAYEAVLPWGTVTTDPYPLDSGYIYVDFPVTEELKEIAKEKIIRYNQEYIEAYTQVNDSVFSVASDRLIKEVMDDAEYELEWGRDYKGKFVGINFYEEAFELDYYDQKWYLYVSTDTIYEETIYSFFSTDYRENERDTGYTLVYDKDKADWVVDEVGYVGYLTKDTLVEYRESDPKTFEAVWNEDEEDEE